MLYNLRLVGKSLRRDPWFTAVMIVSQALSVSLFATALTTVRRYSHVSGDVQPDVFRVDAEQGNALSQMYRRTQFEGLGEFSSALVSLPAARALAATGRPGAGSAAFAAAFAGSPDGRDVRRIPVRFCEADFFRIFNLPLEHGAAWTREDEQGPAPAHVVVLSKLLNEQLFDGEDSVGRPIRIGGRSFRVIGVLAQEPGKLHLVDFGLAPENVANLLMPLALADEMRPTPAITWPPIAEVRGWGEMSRSPVAFAEYWVRLSDPAERARFRAAMTAFDPKMTMRPAEEIVAAHAKAPPPYRIFVLFTLVLLEANLVNLMRMLLAKASARAAEIGIHRALGAGRRVIFGRQLTEGVLVSLMGSLLGLALAAPTISAFDRMIPDSPVALALTPSVVALTLLVCLLAGLVSGIYPAWRVSAERPTRHLGAI